MKYPQEKVMYKVVGFRSNSDIYESINIQNIGEKYVPPIMRLTYEVGKKTVPNVGKIFCFESFARAKAWGNGIGCSFKVIKGKVTGVTKSTAIKRILSKDEWDSSTVVDFWNNPTDATNYDSWPIPLETIMCDSFETTEVVPSRY